MSRRDLALHLLREAGSRGITTAEFMQAGVGSRYGARLMELRQLGHVIESTRIREASWRYTLTHDAGVGSDGDGSLPSASPAAHPGASASRPRGTSPEESPASGPKLQLFPDEPANAALTDLEAA